MTTLAEALAFGQGIERPFLCPSHEDTNASASVNVALGVWYCFTCQAHGTLDDHVPTIEEALSVLSGKAKPRVYAEAWLDIFDAYQPSPYWAKRYGADLASDFRCGTHPVTGNPTYPLRGPDGLPRGVVQRQEGDPKYLYPAGVRISDTFFGRLTAQRGGGTASRVPPMSWQSTATAMSLGTGRSWAAMGRGCMSRRSTCCGMQRRG